MGNSLGKMSLDKLTVGELIQLYYVNEEVIRNLDRQLAESQNNDSIDNNKLQKVRF